MFTFNFEPIFALQFSAYFCALIISLFLPFNSQARFAQTCFLTGFFPLWLKKIENLKIPLLCLFSILKTMVTSSWLYLIRKRHKMMSQSRCHISFLSFTHITSTQNNMPHINLNVSLYCVSISTSPLSTAAGIALTLIVELCAIIALSMSKYTHDNVFAYLEVIVDCLNAKRCVCIRIKFIFMEKTRNAFCKIKHDELNTR